MCIKDNFNQICFIGNEKQINEFMDDCEINCIHYGSCDYYSMLDDKLKNKTLTQKVIDR